MDVSQWFFDGWPGPLRVLVVGTSAYVALLVMLRVSGNRTLSKMNAFDFVVTIALGSTLATVLLSKQTDLAEGLAAIALLILLQWAITWLAARSSAVSRLVKSEPVLLVRDGEPLPTAMRRARVTEAEVLQAAREQGLPNLGAVRAMVLENDGEFSVISGIDDGQLATLSNVNRLSK